MMITKLVNTAAPCRFRAKILEERPAPGLRRADGAEQRRLP